MRLHVLSDLHIEFGPYSAPVPECDVVVLAGDTHTKTRGPAWARAHFGDRVIIYVAGNHEYYGGALPREDDKLREACEEHGVHFLQMNELVLGDVRFLGATLWTDYDLFGNKSLARFDAQRMMSDHKKIRVTPGYGKLRPAHLEATHWSHRRWLDKKLQEAWEGSTVVVTHHAPTNLTTMDRFRNARCNPAYASRLEEMILDRNPDVWIHGHTHVAKAARIGETRIVSNARGYVGQEHVENFSPDLVIDV